MGGADGAAGGFHNGRVIARYIGDPGFLVDRNAFRAGGAGETERIIQRVEMRSVLVVDPAVITVARYRLAYFLAREKAHFRVAIFRGHVFDLGAVPVCVALFPGCLNESGFQVAFNRVASDQFFHKRVAFYAEIPQAMGPFAAKAFFQRTLVLALADAKLAAIAARRAPADALRFQDDDGIAAFGKVKRRGQTRIACTYDADIGGDIALQRRDRRSIVRGGRVV